MKLRSPLQLSAGFLVLATALLTCFSAQAQTAQESFGRVRIQYKDFKWQQLSTQNFVVYYYQDGEASARRAAEYAESELQRITALIGYYPYSKTSLLLYNSVGDLRQSNIGLDTDRQQVGGQTSLTRMSKVQIAFTGQQTDFKRELSYQITQVLLNDMMYGGSLKEVLQSSYLLQLPDWFIGGASAYASEGWSVNMDGYMRDMTRQYPTGNRTAPFFLRDSRLAGQSIWNYVAERYGYNTIQNILNLTRITRDVEVGISSSLNVPYKIFLRDWLTYYRDLNNKPATVALGTPEEKSRISGWNRHNAVYSQPVLSPNGQQLAYAENEQGRYRVMVANRDGSRRHTVSRGGYKTPDQQVETRLPALAWRGNTQVAIAEESRGKMALHLREARGMAVLSRLKQAIRFRRPASVFDAYSQVLGISYSPDGKALVFSAVRDGQNDIYLLRAGGRVEQLTNDLFDDAQPVFLPNGQGIVFSSNRYLDSAGVARPATFPNVVNNYDLFLYHLDGRPRPVETLVSTISNETRPRALSDSEIIYLGEESGVRSLYRYSLTTHVRTPITSFAGNFEDADYNAATNTLAFVSRGQARHQLFVLPGFQPAAGLLLGKTARQQTLEDRSVAVATPAKPAAPVMAADTVVARPAATTGTGKEKNRRKAADKVNTSDYEFEEDEPVTAQGRRGSQPSAEAAAPRNSTLAEVPHLSGPYRYDTRFMIENVVSSVAVDPLLGIGLVGQANLADVFENQRIKASIFGLLDFRTSNIQVSYTNITHRIDWGVSYQKQAYFFDQVGAYQLRYGRHEVSPFFAYPLTHNLTVRGGPRYVNINRTQIEDPSFSTALDLTRNYGGFNGELVFDNSIATGVNMLLGTRMKLGVLQLYSLENKKLNYGKIYVDLRHYQKIVRQLVWANRASYGQFLGPAPQLFRLGGVDSWLNYKYNDDQLISATPNGPAVTDPTEVFAQQFVTNLRGFNYSTQTGSRYLLFNTELRFPIVQFLTRKPIYSGFFRNLQLTAFADAGTAYTGTNPFSENNSNNRDVRGGFGNYFTANVINFESPLLVGYGFGARTTMLGFYLKGDLAWGEQNFVRSGPKFYLSLGYDF
jgi:Tol biopolymer transport system component